MLLTRCGMASRYFYSRYFWDISLPLWYGCWDFLLGSRIASPVGVPIVCVSGVVLVVALCHRASRLRPVASSRRRWLGAAPGGRATPAPASGRPSGRGAAVPVAEPCPLGAGRPTANRGGAAAAPSRRRSRTADRARSAGGAHRSPRAPRCRRGPIACRATEKRYKAIKPRGYTYPLPTPSPCLAANITGSRPTIWRILTRRSV